MSGQLALSKIICQLKLTYPVKESQLYQELKCKIGHSFRSERSLPIALRKSEKDSEYKKFVLLSPNASGSWLQITPLPPNPLNNKISTN